MQMAPPAQRHHGDVLIREAHARKRRRRWVSAFVVVVGIAGAGAGYVFVGADRHPTVRTVPRPVAATTAAALCEQSHLPGTLTSATATTVVAIRLMSGSGLGIPYPRGPHAHAFRGSGSNDLAAWCWTKSGSGDYTAWAAANRQAPIKLDSWHNSPFVPRGDPDNYKT
jgi:hypothetical protein